MAVDFRQLLRPPWTWACLACDATGTGPSNVHRCTGGASWRCDFWRARLRFAGLSSDEASRVVAQPIAREELVRILGDRWRPENTAPIAMHAGVRKEAA